MSNTARTIALVVVSILAALPLAAPAAGGAVPAPSHILSDLPTGSAPAGLLARGPAQDPDGAPSAPQFARGPAQDPNGALSRGPAQDPNGGLSALRLARGPAQDPNGGLSALRLARGPAQDPNGGWSAQVGSVASQGVVIARLLSV